MPAHWSCRSRRSPRSRARLDAEFLQPRFSILPTPHRRNHRSNSTVCASCVVDGGDHAVALLLEFVTFVPVRILMLVSRTVCGEPAISASRRQDLRQHSTTVTSVPMVWKKRGEFDAIAPEPPPAATSASCRAPSLEIGPDQFLVGSSPAARAAALRWQG